MFCSGEKFRCNMNSNSLLFLTNNVMSRESIITHIITLLTENNKIILSCFTKVFFLAVAIKFRVGIVGWGMSKADLTCG